MTTIIKLLLLSVTLTTLPSSAQNTGRIYTSPSDSHNGSFVFPRSYPLTFREGSSINISWTTTYRSANLFYYQRGKVANSIQLATNQALHWFQWRVSADETNLTEPFVFRVVNGQGSNEEVALGGFWSASFYIWRVDAAESGVATISSAAATTLSASTMATRPATLASREQVPSNSTMIAGPAGTEKGASQTPMYAPAESISRRAVAGLAVGFSVTFFVIIAALMYLYSRRRRYSMQVPEAEGSNDHAPPIAEEKTQNGKPRLVAHEVYVSPTELEGSKTWFELPVTKECPRVEDGCVERRA